MNSVIHSRCSSSSVREMKIGSTDWSSSYSAFRDVKIEFEGYFEQTAPVDSM